jgi:shikimate dehydrogenase
VTSLRFAVIGDPVGHSRSPAMHAAAYEALGLPHTYRAVRVATEDLPRVVDDLRAGAFHGLNVTVPHKERVLAWVDEIDATARAIGAANTLVRSAEGRVSAHNTDAPALAAEVQALLDAASGPRPVRGRALVLGSGGAARAAVAAARTLGFRDIAVRARSFADDARRERFVGGSPAPVAPQLWAASPESERETALVIQATSAGMRGADPGEDVASVVAWDRLPEGAVAYDVVYAPRDTPFLRRARARSVPCDDGLGMLARQGALAFELWLGRPAPLDVMRAALERA